jgi:succinate dehydrogenase/fumarate reductase flavoprotein subunit
MPEPLHLETDVLIIGAGGAGMSAALAAAAEGANVILADRSLIGRGGATIMAQMTVAVALGSETDDNFDAHFADTIAAGRGLCDPRLAEIVVADGPAAIRELDQWKVGWARHPDGRIKQAHAPGHDRPRCVYVDFLSTGPAVSKTLRGQVQRHDNAIRRIGDLFITDIVVQDGVATGAVGFAMNTGQPIAIAAGATIIATGGLTRLYRRNSASLNMSGDGYGLALRAGAELLDMEFVQFFPIGHLAPRMIGMDPIMWDPFRYKLGGRLLNGDGVEFMDNYGTPEDGKYVVTRDRATYSILKEVAAGRGSPAGGAWLSFQHVPAADLRAAFGPVVDRLAANGIDLTKTNVEVAPIAHYHMGGVRVDPTLESGVPNLFVAGEAIGGSNGANRLSGNAITEALVFGKRTGAAAAKRAARGGAAKRVARGGAAKHLDGQARQKIPATALALPQAGTGQAGPNTAAAIVSLQATMADLVGPFRTEASLTEALRQIAALRDEIGDTPPNHPGPYDAERIDWFDLRTMLQVADIVTTAALARTESRGAHQREDHPGLDAAWDLNQIVKLDGNTINLTQSPVPTREPAR